MIGPRAAAALLAGLLATAAPAADRACTAGDGHWIRRACFAEPLDPPRYGHGVLGDTPEWAALRADLGPGGRAAFRAPALHLRVDPASIIEDVAPRLGDLTGDGIPEIVYVESALGRGARLVAFDLAARRAIATPHIGRQNRWLAPVGIADLDADGRAEIAYVDRPHLARILRLWAIRQGRFVQLASLEGVTNHDIGQNKIQGGIRHCPNRPPEMILADPAWRRILAVTWDGRRLAARPLGPLTGPGGLAAARACP